MAEGRKRDALKATRIEIWRRILIVEAEAQGT